VHKETTYVPVFFAKQPPPFSQHAVAGVVPYAGYDRGYGGKDSAIKMTMLMRMIAGDKEEENRWGW